MQALKAEHPGAVVVSYVNTTAAVKALSDICCTSANAVQIVQSIPGDREIIFTPDRNLGAWAAKKAERELILWPGFCPTHELIEVTDVEAARAAHPGAKVVVHPECPPEVSEIADAVESTSGMIRFCREDDAKEYLIGTELGMLYRLAKDCPGKRFYPVTELSVCPNMKMTTLEKVLGRAAQRGPRRHGRPRDPGQGSAGRAADGGGRASDHRGSLHLPQGGRPPLLELRRARGRWWHRRV